MKRSYGIKQKLEPTPSQEARLRVLVGHARFVWNAGLDGWLDELMPAANALPC